MFCCAELPRRDRFFSLVVAAWLGSAESNLRDMDEKDEMKHEVVDLQLAATYVPGLRAMAQSLFLLFVVHCLQLCDVALPQVLVCCAAVLYVDRHMWVSRIVDANACCLCILMALAINVARVDLQSEQAVAHAIVDGPWAVICLILISDGPQMLNVELGGTTWAQGAREIWIEQSMTVLTAVVAALHAFMSFPQIEGNLAQYIRGLLFTFYAVLWVYTSYLGSGMRRVSFEACAHRLLPLLLAEWYVAMVFAVLAFLAVLYRAANLARGNNDRDAPKGPAAVARITPVAMDDTFLDPDVLAAFNAAKLARSNAGAKEV